MRVKNFVGGALAVGAACLLVASAAAGSGPSRVLDRTFSCGTGYLGGIYQVRIATDWSAPPGSSRLQPSASASTNLEAGSLGDIGRASMDVNRANCQQTSQNASLTTTGLSGGAFSRLPTEYACGTSRRVLLRIRGDFVKPTAFHAASPFGYPMLLAGGATTQTQLAVATLKGKPIAYASISRSKTQVYTSQACRED